MASSERSESANHEVKYKSRIMVKSRSDHYHESNFEGWRINLFLFDIILLSSDTY